MTISLSSFGNVLKALAAATWDMSAAVCLAVLVASPVAGFSQQESVPVKIAGTADTGDDATFATFHSGELRAVYNGTQAPKGILFLVLHFSFRHGKDYTNGAQEYWDAKFLVLHTPSGGVITTGFGNTPDPCDSCVAVYQVPQSESGTYTVVNTYKGYGTRNGQVIFNVPRWGATGVAVVGEITAAQIGAGWKTIAGLATGALVLAGGGVIYRGRKLFRKWIRVTPNVEGGAQELSIGSNEGRDQNVGIRCMQEAGECTVELLGK